MNTLPRISARVGQLVDLNNTFYASGIPTDPFAILKVQIYRSSVQAENLVAEIPMLSKCDVDYPSPLSREYNTTVGDCGTVPPQDPKPGIFHLFWQVPTGLITPDIYFDVWTYVPTDPGLGTACSTDEEAALEDEDNQLRCCNKFWIYPDSFQCDDGLENIRLGFEPLDTKFYSPEKKILEVGIMPLPLYDFNYNKIMPLLPLLQATITVFTDHQEVVIDKAAMSIGLRMGTYRTNPFTLKYLLDSSKLFKGSYKFKVEVALPNGETRVSPEFPLQVN